MEKLDLKDRKILYHLDIDSRQSFSQLGKKVGLHKDVVAYRVKKLTEKKIITEFATDINIKKLGRTPVRFYFTFQYVNSNIKKEIIDYFVKSPYTHGVHSCKGHYDLTIISCIDNIPMHYDIWNEAIKKFRDYFANQVFSVQNMIIEYKNTFLINENPDKSIDRFLFKEEASEKTVKIDDLDKKILRLISQDSRKKTSNLAEKLNTTVNTVNSRINKLVKSGIIHNFRIFIDFPKIGYQWYKADIILKNPSIAPKIIKIAEVNPHLIATIKSLGYVDVELIFCLKDAS